MKTNKNIALAGLRFSFLLFTISLFYCFTASPARAAIVINEVAFDEPSGSPDWVELYNNGNSAVSINGWTLDDVDAATPVTINLSAAVPAGGYVVIFIDVAGSDETDFSDNVVTLYSGTTTTVGLAASEDEVALYNSATQSSATIVDFTAYVGDGQAYGGIADQNDAILAGIWSSGTYVSITDTGSGYSIGRVNNGVDTNAASDWVKFAGPTQGTSNGGGTVGGGTGASNENCSNGLDDDADGLIDCADGDCLNSSECLGGVTASTITAKNLEVDPTRNPFSPYDTNLSYQNVPIMFHVTSASVVKTIRVSNIRGEIVRVLVDNDTGPTGTSLAGLIDGSVLWDGRDDEGNIVPVGIYIVFMEAVDSVTGERVTGKDTVAVGREF
ncbi:MAG TPA: lamin tail domain-containing protein [Elusimicrobiota bacterium]|nr:lamin tail domain-containing protein [Elusimicrobiota bacterium]